MRSSNTSRKKWFRVALASVFFVHIACAIDPYRGVSQYIRDRWGADKGFPSGPVYAITQSADGYLWIGAESGLIRFDGLTFRHIEPTPPAPLSVGQVLGLTTDSQGNLWIRVRGLNVLRYRDGGFRNAVADLDQLRVTVMTRTEDGEVFFATARNGLLALRGAGLETLIGAQFMPGSPVISLARTADGDIWMGTRDQGLARWRAGKVSAITEGLPNLKINCLLPVAPGELWIGTDSGIVRWDGAKISKTGLPPALEHVQALAMIRDKDANIWAGTGADGLLRINARGVSALKAMEGEAITAVFEDREGNLWTGSVNGIERIRDSVFATYSSAEGLPSENNGPIYTDGQNRTWFAPVSGGLYSLRDGKVTHVSIAGLDKDVVYSIAGNASGGDDELWIGRQRGGVTHLRPNGESFTEQTYTKAAGLAQDSVFTVTESRDGAVWAGTLNSGVSRFRDGRFITYTTANGLVSNTISSILEGTGGSMWFATPSGLSVLSNGQFRTYSVKDGLPSENVNCLFEDSTGTLWIGTLGGLAFLRAGRVQIPAGMPASLKEQIFGIAEDKLGSLWIATENHVVRVNRDRFERGLASAGDMREYGIADGLRSLGGVKRHRSVTADSSGRIWLSMARGLSVVDPARLAGRSVPAMVHVQGIEADGNPVALADPIRIQAGRQRITVDFAGLSLAIPERTRFRYTLDGFDHGWSAPVSARQAIYTNLGPGPYRFHVIASNLDEVFNSTEATVSFQIEPTLWQNWWFRSSVLLAFTLGLIAFFRFRTLRLTRQMSVRFEERLAERARIAQELHDTLLQGFLSTSMQLHVVADGWPEDSPTRQPLDRILALMDRVIREGRDALRDLRSSFSEATNLEQAFSRIQQELGAREKVAFRVIVEGSQRPLHPILRDEVYRIGREALVNAFRHSNASSIEVELEYAPKEFRILIRDNGCGIDPVVLRSGREGHWGLPGIRERAERIGARVRLWSRAGAGTEVELSVPGHIAYQIVPQRRSRHWYSRVFQRRSGIRK